MGNLNLEFLFKEFEDWTFDDIISALALGYLEFLDESDDQGPDPGVPEEGETPQSNGNGAS